MHGIFFLAAGAGLFYSIWTWVKELRAARSAKTKLSELDAFRVRIKVRYGVLLSEGEASSLFLNREVMVEDGRVIRLSVIGDNFRLYELPIIPIPEQPHSALSRVPGVD